MAIYLMDETEGGMMAEKTEFGHRQGPGQEPGLTRFLRSIEGDVSYPNSHLLLLGMEPIGTAELVERVEEGFSYGELEHLRENMDLSRNEIAELVRMTPRTLDRRRKEGRLQPEESDRLLRLCRVFGSALELFEADVEAAREWLSSPQMALGGSVPFDMARSEIGAREVESLIGRLEHGVFS